MRDLLNLCGVFVALAIALSPFHREPAAHAGTALRMDVEQLVESADLVLEGRVTRATPVETPGGLIETVYELEVRRTFLGEDLYRRTLRLPGGILEDGRGLVLAGMPRPVVGEEALLFLTAAGEGGLRVPVGLAQGRYRIVRGLDGARVAVRDQSDLGLVEAAGGVPVEADAQHRRDYAELVAEIEAAVERKRALGPRNGATGGE